ncbi:MAG: hypothetical protein K8L97_33545 [Anaerolineae bacterium]|nr:hypothetical protein [Anaerolineae bacterium]
MTTQKHVDYRKRAAVVAAYKKHQPTIQRMLALKRQAEFRAALGIGEVITLPSGQRLVIDYGSQGYIVRPE